MTVLRILANENVPGPVIAMLRQRGHDVVAIVEEARGLADAEVLARAQRDQRTVVTFDKDFGGLAFAARMPANCGVILFRLSGTAPDVDNRRVVAALESRTDWNGKFAIVEDDRIRVREVP